MVLNSPTYLQIKEPYNKMKLKIIKSYNLLK